MGSKRNGVGFSDKMPQWYGFAGSVCNFGAGYTGGVIQQCDDCQLRYGGPQTTAAWREEKLPSGAPSSIASPSPTPAESAPRCVPIGDCGAYSWCDQDLYRSWCASQTTPCSVPYCKASNGPAPLPTMAPASVPT